MTLHNHDETNSPFLAFLAGGLAGVALGLLFAPKSGKENREILQRTARDNLTKMQQKVNQGQDKAKTKFNEAVDKTQAAISDANDAADVAEATIKAHGIGKHAIL